MNGKFPKIAFILFVIAALFLIVDGFLTGKHIFWLLAGFFLIIGLLFTLDNNDKK